MKSTMKRCLAFATVLAMLLSVCALPAFAAPTIAAPCEHAADVEPETVYFDVDENTHSRYDKYECDECNAKWITNVVLGEEHDHENVVTKPAAYNEFEIDPETGDPVPTVDGREQITPTCACNHTKEVEYGKALTHGVEGNPDPDACCVYTVVTPATCVEDGEYTYVCKNNGPHPLEGGVIPALGHKYTLGAYDASTATVTVDCANGCGGFTATVVTEAPEHSVECEGEVEHLTRTADCVAYGVDVYKCDTCDFVYATNYVAATKHDVDTCVYVALSCENDEQTFTYCKNCIGEIFGAVTPENADDVLDYFYIDGVWNLPDADGNLGLTLPVKGETATGHYYMDGETRVDIDPTVCNEDAEGNGVTCVACSEYFGHVWVDMETPATCTENGASWKECACGETKDYAPITAPGHTEILDEENSYEATDVADGLAIYICDECGEELRREVLDAAYDIVFSATAKNQFNGTAYVQNSIVAYTVALNAADLAVGSIRLAVSFDAALTYMGYDLGADNANAFGAYVADNMGTTSVGVAGNVVTVYAYSANYSEGQVAPVVLDGEQEFVTLYFAVNSDAAAGAYALSIAGCEVMNVDLSTDYDVNVAADVAVVVETLGDLNGDNAITIEDQMIVNGFIASSMNESAPLYDVHADINQDGIVDFADLYVVNQYLNTSYTLEMLLAVGDVRPAPEA